MGWIIDGFKSFHRSVKEGEHLKEENLRTREELAEIQVRRGKICIYGVIGAAILVSVFGEEVKDFITSFSAVLPILAGVSGIGAGLYNKKIRLQ